MMLHLRFYEQASGSKEQSEFWRLAWLGCLEKPHFPDFLAYFFFDPSVSSRTISPTNSAPSPSQSPVVPPTTPYSHVASPSSTSSSSRSPSHSTPFPNRIHHVFHLGYYCYSHFYFSTVIAYIASSLPSLFPDPFSSCLPSYSSLKSSILSSLPLSQR